MGTISKPNTFTANTTIASSQVNANFDTIYNEFNGGISSANLADDAVTTDKIADGAVTTDKLASGIVDSGWAITGGTHTVSTGYNAGNRSFTIDTSTDISGVVSEGMRYRVERGTTPPTQCADLEASSSQYASVSSPTGLSFTTTFTAEAWVKLESYGATSGIVCRRNGATEGWSFAVLSDGTVQIIGLRIAGNNKQIVSYQSIPLNKWVHVAATLDMAVGDTSAQKIWIDGIEVPRAYTLAGTATALVQGTTTLEVGTERSGGTSPMDGKLGDVRVWSDQRSATEIQDNMYGYPSDTTGLVAHFKLNGDFTDSAGTNDLTAQNSAVATDTDNPWNATEYGIITAVSSSDITVFCPEGYGIPNETLSNPYYSGLSTPYGFPRDKGLWAVETYSASVATVTSSWTNPDELKLEVPQGAWELSYMIVSGVARSGLNAETSGALSESTTAVSTGYETTVSTGQAYDNVVHEAKATIYKEYASSTVIYAIIVGTLSSGNLYNNRGNLHRIVAKCAHI